jgi:hypothetical protein
MCKIATTNDLAARGAFYGPREEGKQSEVKGNGG